MPSQFKKVLDEMSARHPAAHVKSPELKQFRDRIGFAEWNKRQAAPSSARQPSAAQIYLTETRQDVLLEHLETSGTFSLDDLKRRIHAGLTKRQVSLLRRRFAQHNHPDRHHPSQRDHATELMAQANDLLDCVWAESDEFH